MAGSPASEPTTPPPPPVISKAGRYTIFITPPATPRPPPEKPVSHSPLTPITLPQKTPSSPAPPVQVPPPQFKKPAEKGAGLFGFLWDAAAKVQNAHSRLDLYMAEWLGLNQSRYQWAVDDYYENAGSSKDCDKPKDLAGKDQAV